MATSTLFQKGIVFAILACCAAVLGLPFFWMIVTALKPVQEIAAYPPTWFPRHAEFTGFVEAWHAAPFARFYLNSIVTGVATTALQVSFALLMAYAFVFIPVPGRTILLLLVLATMMIPDEMKLIPNYLLLGRLGWIDTYWGLIVPPAAHAFPVFVLYQQLRLVPHELAESARVDGAGHLRTLHEIIVPLSRPMLAAVLLVAFIGRWNDYLWPLVATNSVSMRTLPIGLAYLQEVEEGSQHWNRCQNSLEMSPSLAP